MTKPKKSKIQNDSAAKEDVAEMERLITYVASALAACEMSVERIPMSADHLAKLSKEKEIMLCELLGEDQERRDTAATQLARIVAFSHGLIGVFSQMVENLLTDGRSPLEPGSAGAN